MLLEFALLRLRMRYEGSARSNLILPRATGRQIICNLRTQGKACSWVGAKSLTAFSCIARSVAY